MDANARFWRDDVVEHVLSLLPVPDLCRTRTVCKQWNAVISHRHFAALHAQKQTNLQDATSIVFRYVASVFTHPDQRLLPDISSQWGCCILDLDARRWYRIEDSTNPDKFVQARPDRVAMDGGLVAQFSYLGRSDYSLVVYNPIGNEARTLPIPPDVETHDELSFLVDPTFPSFKVFLINYDRRKLARRTHPSTSEPERAHIPNAPLVRVYDSVSREWENLVDPDDTSEIRLLCSTAMLPPRLLLLFERFWTDAKGESLRGYGFWVYDLVEKDWVNLATTMDLPEYQVWSLGLVATTDRLFLAYWSLDLVSGLCFQVHEIDVVEMVMRKPPVLKLSKGEVVSRFGIQLTRDAGMHEHMQMVVVGIASSRLLVMSNASGKCGVFDVARGEWQEEMPENPLGPQMKNENRVWVGKNMKLLLPHAPW